VWLAAWLDAWAVQTGGYKYLAVVAGMRRPQIRPALQSTGLRPTLLGTPAPRALTPMCKPGASRCEPLDLVCAFCSCSWLLQRHVFPFCSAACAGTSWVRMVAFLCFAKLKLVLRGAHMNKWGAWKTGWWWWRCLVGGEGYGQAVQQTQLGRVCLIHGIAGRLRCCEVQNWGVMAAPFPAFGSASASRPLVHMCVCVLPASQGCA